MPKVDPFAAYALPPSLVDGVSITIPGDGASVTFRVAPPSQTLNVSFQASMARRLAQLRIADAEHTLDTSDVVSVREDAFRETCILSAEGIPDGDTITDFLNRYPMIFRIIYQQALELSLKMDSDFEAMVGNLNASSNGRRNGRGGSQITKPSPTPALSDQKTAVRN